FRKRSFTADEVQKVVVHIASDEANTVSNREMPDICLQHMIAVMLLDKTVTFASAHDKARMQDPTVLRQRAKVDVVADPRIDARRPRREAIVEFTLADGTQLTEWVRDVRGTAATASASPPRKKPFYTGLSFQVLLGVAMAILLGYISPANAVAMKPLGDAFIRLITMIITLVIFCTLVTGIAGMEDMKKVGRVGGKALLYFELVSTLALLIGLVVGNLVHPGSGFNVNPATLDARAVADYAGQARAQSVADFLMHIIPATVFDAFARGDILQVLLVSLLFGFALSLAGSRGRPLVDLLDSLTRVVFGVVAILMRFAPIGAFGAMAFTVGKYGLASVKAIAPKAPMGA